MIIELEMSVSLTSEQCSAKYSTLGKIQYKWFNCTLQLNQFNFYNDLIY